MISSFDEIPGNLIDQPLRDDDGNLILDSGYSPEVSRGDTPESLCAAAGDALIDFPNSWWIPKNEWPDWCERNDKNGTWGLNYLNRFTHQGGSHECTCHMLRAMAESARNLARAINYLEGPKVGQRLPLSDHSVWLAPNSVYPEANPGIRGGAGCRQVLEIARRRGMLPSKVQPSGIKFKHAVYDTAGGRDDPNQSTGPWLPLSKFPEGWPETGKWFKPKEIIVTTDPEATVCLLLRSRVIGYGRDGHAVPPAAWNCKTNAAPYPDSYNRILADGWNTFRNAVRGGALCIVSMSEPDDWSKPVPDHLILA